MKFKLKPHDIYDWSDVPVIIDMPTVCQLFKVSRPTVDSWMRLKGMPYLKIGQTLRFNRDDVNKWMGDCHTPSIADNHPSEG